MTLEELTALEEIKQLKSRYFRFLDTKDWKAWRELFTDDFIARVEWTRTPLPSDGVAEPLAANGDDFVRTVAELLEGTITVHHGHMPQIALTGPDRAEGIWAMEDIVEHPGVRLMRGYGHYHETYRKEAGHWRIATLHLTRLRMDEAQSVLNET